MVAELTIMGSLSSKNKNVKNLLCVIDVFTKYAWAETLKEKKSKTVLIALPNKLWVDQRREFYNKLMQEWLDSNEILIYSTHNEVSHWKIYQNIKD